MSTRITLRACGLIMLAIPARTSWSATSSSLSADLGADNNNGHNYYLSGEHNFSPGFQLSAGAGKSLTTDSTGTQVQSSSYMVGIQSDPASTFSTGLNRNHAHQADNLDINSTTLTLELNTLNWNAYISPESRNISLVTNIRHRTYSFRSNGYTLGAGYYGWDPAFISWSHSAHSYPPRIGNISSRPRLSNYVFGSDTVDQLFSLEDWHNTFEVGYLFTNTSISFRHSRGHSAVDQSILTTNKIDFSWRVSHAWLFDTMLGRSQLDTSNTITAFGNLGLTYKW